MSEFEEVRSKIIGNWLLLCALGILFLVGWGGYTRLTRSGLSIVEWKPIRGVIPPLNQKEWQIEFEKYKNYPEYKHNPRKITLEEFKQIYWVEFLHRLFGRAIGLIFVLPLFWFWWKGWLNRELVKQLLFILLLGLFQAAWGWFMVKSGLQNRPRVSQYRLAGHLVFASFIYIQIFWLGISYRWGKFLKNSVSPEQRKFLKNWSWKLITFLLLLMFLGALVAGLRAGYLYNTFPTFDGFIIPEGLFALKPVYLNFFENQLTVQFQHRLVGILFWGSAIWFWLSAQKYQFKGKVNWLIFALPVLVSIQLALGISTLLSYVALPLGISHQLGAFVILSLLITFARIGSFRDRREAP